MRYQVEMSETASGLASVTKTCESYVEAVEAYIRYAKARALVCVRQDMGSVYHLTNAAMRPEVTHTVRIWSVSPPERTDSDQPISGGRSKTKAKRR